jgi:hypothetical protein
MGQHTNRKTGHAMNEQNKISGCVCSGMLFAALHESGFGHFRDIPRSRMDFRFRGKNGHAADITTMTDLDPGV